MDKNKIVLVEVELFRAISAFHECDSKKKREFYVQEYFHEFCKKYDIDELEAIDILDNIFEDRRKNTVFEYEHYKDGLGKIIFPEQEKNKTTKKGKEERER